MTKKLSERRAKENEKLVQDDNESIAKAAKAIYGENKEIHFYCECTTVDCLKRIDLAVKDYKKVHDKPNMFIVVPSHEDLTIESIVDEQPDFYIVEKR